MLRMYVSFLYFSSIKVYIWSWWNDADQRSICFHEINTFSANECDRLRRWEEERLKSLHLYVSPLKHLINSLKERCNVFCIYTCLTLRWKVICSCHHSKLIKNEMTGLSRAVGSCCSVMGCRSYRLNFSRGRGQRGERENNLQ